MKTTQTTANIALLALRLITGAVFAFHGSQKLFGWFGGYGLHATGQYMESIGIPFGTVSALLAGSAEFFGGLLLICGVLVGVAALPMVFTMLVAVLMAHSGFDAQHGGMEYPLTLLVVLASLGLLGPGEWTVRKLVPAARKAQETVSAKA